MLYEKYFNGGSFRKVERRDLRAGDIIRITDASGHVVKDYLGNETFVLLHTPVKIRGLSNAMEVRAIGVDPDMIRDLVLL